MRCPKCRNHVLQKSGSRTRLRIQGQVIFEDGRARAKCYWCKSEVEIPISLQLEAPILTERFVIARDST